MDASKLFRILHDCRKYADVVNYFVSHC